MSKIENEPVEEQEQDNEISVKEIEDTIQSKVSKISNRVDSITEKFVEYKKQNENLTKTNELLTKELANLKVELDRANSATQTSLKERELFDKEADRQTKRHVSDSENSASIWKSVATVVSAAVGIVATVITCILKFS